MITTSYDPETHYAPVNKKVSDQILQAAESRGLPQWIDAAKWLPENARCVLAHDGEAHFIACWSELDWYNCHTDEAIDSVILGWMELFEIPED